MGKFRLAFKTQYGEITIEGDSISDFKNRLAEIGISSESIDNIINTIIDRIEHQDLVVRVPISVAPSKPEQAGVIEYGSDGVPHITVPTDKMSAKEVMGLLLYAKSPSPISMTELRQLVVNNWKSVELPYISSNLSMMRAYIIKEGAKGSYSYKLSGSGKNWVENELLPKLKMRSEKD